MVSRSLACLCRFPLLLRLFFVGAPEACIYSNVTLPYLSPCSQGSFRRCYKSVVLQQTLLTFFTVHNHCNHTVYTQPTSRTFWLMAVSVTSVISVVNEYRYDFANKAQRATLKAGTSLVVINKISPLLSMLDVVWHSLSICICWLDGFICKPCKPYLLPTTTRISLRCDLCQQKLQL
jgi:phage terminase large subunit-like protein